MVGRAFLAEMKLPTPKPASQGVFQQAESYDTVIHEPTTELSDEEKLEASRRYLEKTLGIYDKMVHRNPDGSDPLVPEPKGKP
jgi:hypothetical protein